MFATILHNYKFFREESVPRVPPRMRGCHQAVQNTHVGVLHRGNKRPGGKFLQLEAVTGYYYIHNSILLTPYDGDRRPEPIIFSEPVGGANRWIVGLYAHS